jgi:hypothetical protein
MSSGQNWPAFNPNVTLSANSELGNWEYSPTQNGQHNLDPTYGGLGQFTCSPQLQLMDDAIYLCSATLTNHKGLLPCGMRTCIRRIPVDEPQGGVVNHQQLSEKNWIDCGGLVLKTIDFSLRNWAGAKLPLGHANMSFQIVCGYP